MNYKQAIANYLRQLADGGMTHQEIARALGIKSGPAITAHLDPANSISPFPISRLPALAKLLDLTPIESLQLITLRAIHHGDSASKFDRRSLHWILTSVISVKDRSAMAAKSHGDHRHAG